MPLRRSFQKNIRCNWLLNKIKSEFSRNVVTLMTGSIIAQAIPIAISPILTRIYTPEDFGLLALYMSIASVFATFATGRYELAIMLPKKDGDAVNVLFLSLAITFMVSFVSFLIVFLFNSQIIELLSAPSLANWLYVIPFSVLFTGLYQSLNYWMNRTKKYKKLAVGRIVQSSATGTTNLGMGWGGFGASGLIIGNLIGQIATTLFLGKTVWKNHYELTDHLSKIKIIALMKKYKKFPFLNLPNALIDSFRMSGINMLIAKYFTTATLGQFSLAWKMVQVPIVLVGGALAQVLFQKVSSVPKADLYVLILKYIIRASLIAAPIFLVIYFFSVDIFSFVFGENWRLAGESASVMAPWLFINFVSSPLVSVMLVLNKQELVLIFSLFYAGVPLGLIIMLRDATFIDVLQAITWAMSVMLVLFSMVIVYQTKKESIS